MISTRLVGMNLHVIFDGRDIIIEIERPEEMPRIESCLEGLYGLPILLSFGQARIAAPEYLKAVSEAATQELLTGERDPKIHGENVVPLHLGAVKTCDICHAPYEPAADDVGLCPDCVRFMEIATVGAQPEGTA